VNSVFQNYKSTGLKTVTNEFKNQYRDNNKLQTPDKCGLLGCIAV
jgi:hypothetical protein